MARHYGTVVLPTRTYAPRDKSKVESAVLNAERRIIAVLRDQTFFSVAEINTAIKSALTDLNLRPFQKMQGSRAELFKDLDQPVLRPLPARRYELGQWRHAKANIDYHVQVDWHSYSVPYTLTQQDVEVRLSVRTVEIFHKGRRVAAQRRPWRLHHRSGAPSTRPSETPAVDAWPSRGLGTYRRTAMCSSRRPPPQNQAAPRTGIPRVLGHHAPGTRIWRTALGSRLSPCPSPGGLHLQEH